MKKRARKPFSLHHPGRKGLMTFLLLLVLSNISRPGVMFSAGCIMSGGHPTYHVAIRRLFSY